MPRLLVVGAPLRPLFSFFFTKSSQVCVCMDDLNQVVCVCVCIGLMVLMIGSPLHWVQPVRPRRNSTLFFRIPVSRNHSKSRPQPNLLQVTPSMLSSCSKGLTRKWLSTLCPGLCTNIFATLKNQHSVTCGTRPLKMPTRMPTG